VVIGAIICLLALIGVSAYYVWRLTKAEPNVTVYRVSLQNVTQSIGGGGVVFARQQLDISYPNAERVITVFVKAGDQVSTNQPLIQLDPTLLNAQITQAANDELAAKIYLDNVSASGNAVTIAQAQQAYNFAKDRYDALVAETASPFLQHGNLVSPMSGIVTAVNVNPGQVFAADAPLLTIMDESTVIVHVKMPLSNLEQVHIGQSAIVTPSALPDRNFQGTVSAVIPQADSQTDTFEVWVAVINKGRMLLPGMSAFVRIQSPGHALVVPRLAVLDANLEPEVFIVQNEHVYLRHVHVVGRSINVFLIDQGLSVGDKVVLIGSYQLQNGQKVRVSGVEGSTS
jgi:RND family efflux transporter MFP subunit